MCNIGYHSYQDPRLLPPDYWDDLDLSEYLRDGEVWDEYFCFNEAFETQRYFWYLELLSQEQDTIDDFRCEADFQTAIEEGDWFIRIVDEHTLIKRHRQAVQTARDEYLSERFD